MEKIIKPSEEKRWEQYYDKKEFERIKPKRTVYREIYERNKDFETDLALEFFYSKKNYSEFFKNIDKTAKSLQEYGIKKGDFVTICAAGIPETVYMFYALSKIGAVANMIAPHFEKKDLINRIEDCESDLLIVMDKFYDGLKESIKSSRIKNIIVVPTLNSSVLNVLSQKYKLKKRSNELFWNQFIKDGKYQNEINEIEYEKNLPLCMVYSSGTTGASKGILLSNDSFQNSVQQYNSSGVDVSRGQKFYQIIPPWYSTGLNTSIHLPLSYGCAVFMDPRFERDIFVKNIMKFKPNYSVAPTSMYEGFLDSKNVGKGSLAHFNYPFEGGEPLRSEVQEKVESVFKEHGSYAKLRMAYGQCECGAAITTQTQNTNFSQGSTGIPVPGVVIGIFDDDYNELGYNERGNVLANTPCSMIEYYKNLKATNEYFYYDKDGKKWNCTGDIGYINENGELFVQGRASDYSIINNKKIYNFDIENIIFSFKEIKMCDVLNKNNLLTVHLIFNDEFKNKVKNDESLLIKLINHIQREILKKYNDIDFVPYIFKVRDIFPYAKSGKRDMKAIVNEEDGFIKVDNNELSDFSFNFEDKKMIKKI